MKVLIYGINFAPESVGVGRYTGEMAAMLRASGHEVHVVTALPYYPEWKVSSTYRPTRYAVEHIDGMKVSRAPLWVPHFPGGRKRVLHLLSFAITSLPLILRECIWRPDLIWMAAPSLVCAPATLLTARLCGARAWIHVQDFEVDVAFDLSVISGRRARRAILGIEHWLLNRFTRVSTISEAMLERARQKGIPENRLLLFPNWADLNNVKPLERPSRYRSQLQIPEQATVALYSGSMGKKQALDWLADLAVRLAHRDDLVFVFCGDGSDRNNAFKICGHLPSVRFLPFQPLEDLGELLGLADIHLLPQRPGASSLVMPSKLTGMLASGRPVVAMADAESELADVVGQCGLVCLPGDLSAFEACISRLCDAPELRREFGTVGHSYASTHLEAQSVLQRLETEMESLVMGSVALPIEPSVRLHE